MKNTAHGFTLVELLLVLAILGIISAIAIPHLLGQRDRAKRIGDAEANARVIAMGMEALKAENGIYGPANARATWTPSSATPSLTGFTANPLPAFNPQGSTRMTFDLNLPTTLTYTLDVYNEGGLTGKKLVSFDQTGSKTVYP